ncbi:MAG: hypothetical protein CMN76_14305 [Spirochaetaceae bacterium]|nr:hypothetical protein [Spirochaetaceae bacterium]|tara:strand:+ start:155547 stop:156710 length:1164 start_codon:yes stop_codon:yes gene_type:complete
MDFIRHKILFIPLLLLVALLSLDQVLKRPEVVKYTVRWTNFERENYQFKEMLFRQLLEESARQKERGMELGLLFGTSRIMEFDNTEIDKLSAGHYTYNFAAPAAPPSYYYYWLERIEEAGLMEDVDFVFLEFDPTVLNKANSRASLAYAYDMQFILENLDLNSSAPANIWNAEGDGFSVKEAETFFLKQYIAFSKYPLNPGNVLENQKTALIPTASGEMKSLQHWEIKQELIQKSRQTLREHRGGRPTYWQPDPDPEELEAHERLTNRVHIQYLEMAPSQMIFFQRTLRLLARHGKKVIIYWPPSTPGLRQTMKDAGLFHSHRDELKNFTETLSRQYPDSRFTLLDPMAIQDLPCLKLVDAYHLKSECFPFVAREVVEILKRQESRN